MEELAGVPAFDRALLGKPRTDITLNFDQKLGHLYEDALQALIEQSPALELIGTHIQVFEDSRTIGELDFIVRDTARNQAVHLELAVKFYMALPDGHGGWRYPGPNDRDNWDRKRAHMMEHQLQLGQTAPARALLQERYGITDIQAAHLIYGCIFMPIAHHERPAPAAISPHARTGTWLRPQEWEAHFSDVQQVHFIPKPLWPVALTALSDEMTEPIPPAELITRAQARGAMFTVKDGTRASETYFMVGDNWGR